MVKKLVLEMPEKDEIGWILENGGSVASMDVLGRPLLAFNVEKVRSVMEIERVAIPEGHKELSSILEKHVPGVEIEEYSEKPEGAMTMPINSIALKSEKGLEVKMLVYPWDILSATSEVLAREVTSPVISPSASIAKTSVIVGPCIISEDVMIDDFCKVKGPIYIGPRTKIWTGSLVRQSIIGEDSVIGFSCEVGKSYLAGMDRLAHVDVVLDSVLGKNVWSGAFLGTTNVLMNNKIVRYKLDSGVVETGLDHFGAVIGHDALIGASTITLPGRFVPPGTFLQAGTVYSGQPEKS